jgi:2-polyprenyl-6-methoxyphenol hydroxylase-like FAD-dependent oxidoreductase
MAEPAVVVVGGGPSGLAVAIDIARSGGNVIVFDAGVGRARSLGEHLSPAARSALVRLGVWDDFCAGPHIPCYEQRSAWGRSDVDARSSIYHPHGAGWLIDRSALDETLRRRAERLGARINRGRIVACRQTGNSWRLDIDGTRSLTAAVVVDATGRRCRVLRAMGGAVHTIDRLVAVAGRFGSAATGRGPTGMLVESTPRGYLYSADGPDGELVAVFVTEPATVAAFGVDAAWCNELLAAPHTAARLAGLRARGRLTTHSAGVQRGVAAPGRRCVAAGDAALAVDPLSGSGVRRALDGAAGAADAALRWADGDAHPAAAYEARLDDELAIHLAERAAVYALESRWSASEFWAARGGATTPG